MCRFFRTCQAAHGMMQSFSSTWFVENAVSAQQNQAHTSWWHLGQIESRQGLFGQHVDAVALEGFFHGLHNPVDL